MPSLRRVSLEPARRKVAEALLETLPISSRLAASRVAGESAAEAVAALEAVKGSTVLAGVAPLFDAAQDEAAADQAVAELKALLAQVGRHQVEMRTEITLDLPAIGLGLRDGLGVAIRNGRDIARVARNAGASVTIGAGAASEVDSTLRVARELRQDFPEIGVTLQARLHRTEHDCRAFAHEDSRVRITRGALGAPRGEAFTDPLEVDKAYVRCLKILMAGQGYPMIATHDARLVSIALSLAGRNARAQGTYEVQRDLGVRPAEARRLAAAGETVRIRIPYGPRWREDLARQIGAHPGAVLSLVRARLGGG